MKAYAIAQNESKVAVSICGPAQLRIDAIEVCRNISSGQVKFDLHVEGFAV